MIYSYARANQFSRTRTHVLPEEGNRALCNFVPKNGMWTVDRGRPSCDCPRCFCKKCHKREQQVVSAQRDAEAPA